MSAEEFDSLQIASPPRILTYQVLGSVLLAVTIMVVGIIIATLMTV